MPVEGLDAWLGGSGWRVAARPTSEFVGIIRGDVAIRATVAPLAHISHRACERCTWACNYKVLPGNPNIDAMMGLALNPHVPIPADKHAVQYHVYARIVKLHFSMEKEITFARHWHRLLVANALLDDA